MCSSVPTERLFSDAVNNAQRLIHPLHPLTTNVKFFIGQNTFLNLIECMMPAPVSQVETQVETLNKIEKSENISSTS